LWLAPAQEIYCERVRCLLDPAGGAGKDNLQVTATSVICSVTVGWFWVAARFTNTSKQASVLLRSLLLQIKTDPVRGVYVDGGW
jgi:hypothetical protein